MEIMPGQKTYLVAIGMILYAIIGVSLGYLEASEAGELIFQAFGLIALRLGIKKAE